MRWGRYRSWLLVGPPLAAVFFVLQFSKIGDPAMNAFLISVGFIVSHLIWNIFYAGHVAMINSMSTVGAKPIQLLGNGNQALGCTLTVVASGVVMILCYWGLFSITTDYAFHLGTNAATEKKEKRCNIL